MCFFVCYFFRCLIMGVEGLGICFKVYIRFIKLAIWLVIAVEVMVVIATATASVAICNQWVHHIWANAYARMLIIQGVYRACKTLNDFNSSPNASIAQRFNHWHANCISVSINIIVPLHFHYAHIWWVLAFFFISQTLVFYAFNSTYLHMDF